MHGGHGVARHAIDRFEQQYRVLWRQTAEKSIDALDEGLNKFTISNSVECPELNNIMHRVRRLKHQKLSDEEYLAEVKALSKDINDLAEKYEFENHQANTFFYHSRRCFKQLVGYSYTEKVPYAQAVLNPHQQAASDPFAEWFGGRIAGHITDVGAKRVADHIANDYTDHVLKYFKMHIDSVEEIRISKAPEKVSPPPPESALKRKMTKEQYKQLRSKVSVKDTQGIADYIAEQLYTYSFDFYFNQVVLRQETLDQVNQIARENALTAEEIDSLKKELLAKHGLLEMDSPESAAFYDNIARVLKFDSADDLYQCYKNLPDKNASSRVEKNVLAFRANAHATNIQVESDPLVQLRAIAMAECERVRDEINGKDYGRENGAYAAQICYMDKELSGGVKKILIARNVLKVAADQQYNLDAIFGEPQERSLWQRVLANIASSAADTDFVKDNIDKRIIRKTLAPDEAMLTRYQNQAYKPIRNTWAQYRAEQQRNENKALASLIQRVVSGKMTYDELLDLQTQARIDNARARRELINHTPGSGEHAKQQRVIDGTNEILTNCKLSLETYRQMHWTHEIAPEKLAKQKVQLAGKKELISNQRKTTIARLTAITKGEAALKQEQKKSSRWYKRLFGIKTKKDKALEAAIKQQGLLRTQLTRNVEEMEYREQQITKDIDAIETREKAITIASEAKLDDLGQSYDTAIREFVDLILRQPECLKGSLKELVENDIRLHQTSDNLNLILAHLNELLAQGVANKQVITKIGGTDVNTLHEDISNLIESLERGHEVIRLSGYDYDVLLQRFRETQENLNRVIESNKEIGQKEFVSKLSAEIETEISANGLRKGDLFKYFAKHNYYGQLDTRHQQKINQKIAEVMVVYVQQNGATMSFSEKRTLLLNLMQGYEYYAQQEPDKHNAHLMAQYDAAINQLKISMTTGYGKLKQEDVKEQASQLSHVESTLISVLGKLDAAKETANGFSKGKERSAWNPLRMIGDWWYGADAHEKELAKVNAYQKHVKFEVPLMVDFLKKHHSQTKAYYMQAPIGELNNGIEKIDGFIEQLSTFKEKDILANENDLNVLLDQCRLMRQELNELRQNHPTVRMHTLHEKIVAQQAEVDKLLRQATEFEEQMSRSELNANAIAQFEKQLSQQLTLKLSLHDTYEEMDRQFHDIMGDAADGLEESKAAKAALDLLENDLGSIQATVDNKMHVYKAILNGQAPSVAGASTETLNQALIVAVQRKNHAAFESIVAQGNRIDIHWIGKAFVMAANQGDARKCQTLATLREDAILPMHIHKKALKGALENEHYQLAAQLLLSEQIDMDYTVAEQLTQALGNKKDSKIPKVNSEWKDWVSRGDFDKLQKYRECFVVVEQLINEANRQYESSNKTSADEAKRLQMVQAARSYYGEKLLERYKHPIASDPDREARYLAEANSYIVLIADRHKPVQRAVLKESAKIASSPAPFPSAVVQQLDHDADAFDPADEQPSHESVEVTKSFVDEDAVDPVEIDELSEEMEVTVVLSDEQKMEIVQEQLFAAVKHWDKSAVMVAISNLNELEETNPNAYYRAMSKAIDGVKEIEYLDDILRAVASPEKRKALAADALLSAIRTGETKRLPVLIHYGGHQGHESDIKQLLAEMNQERATMASGTFSKPHQELPNVTKMILALVNIKMDDSVRQYISDDAAKVREKAQAEKNSQYSSAGPLVERYQVQKGAWQRWARDNDGPKLEKMTDIYYSQESQLSSFDWDFFIEIDNYYHTELSNQYFGDIPEHEIAHLNHMMDIYEERLEQQIEVMKHTRELYIAACLADPSLACDNISRRDEHIAKCNEAFDASVKRLQTKTKKELSSIRNELAARPGVSAEKKDKPELQVSSHAGHQRGGPAVVYMKDKPVSEPSGKKQAPAQEEEARKSDRPKRTKY